MHENIVYIGGSKYLWEKMSTSSSNSTVSPPTVSFAGGAGAAGTAGSVGAFPLAFFVLLAGGAPLSLLLALLEAVSMKKNKIVTCFGFFLLKTFLYIDIIIGTLLAPK